MTMMLPDAIRAKRISTQNSSTNRFSLPRNSLCESAHRQTASHAAGHLSALVRNQGGRSNGSRLSTADATSVQALRPDQPNLRRLPHAEHLHTHLR